MKLSILFIFIFNVAFADDVKVLKKGNPAPFDGVLFSRELEKDIRNDIKILNKKITTLDKINKINEKEIAVLEKRLKLYQKKSEEFSNREIKNEKNTFFKNTIYFLSGALLTGVIGYGVVKAYR